MMAAAEVVVVVVVRVVVVVVMAAAAMMAALKTNYLVTLLKSFGPMIFSSVDSFFSLMITP